MNIEDIDSINDFSILNWTEYSDHAALYFSFIKQLTLDSTTSTQTEYPFQEKIVFNEGMVPQYNEILTQNMENFNSSFRSCTNTSEKVVALTSCYMKKVFGQVISNKSYKTNNSKPKWFDESCFNAKQHFKRARNIFVRNKTNENRYVFVQVHTKYNKVRKKAKYLFSD